MQDTILVAFSNNQMAYVTTSGCKGEAEAESLRQCGNIDRQVRYMIT